jgi:hypothetical protein
MNTFRAALDRVVRSLPAIVQGPLPDLAQWMDRVPPSSREFATTNRAPGAEGSATVSTVINFIFFT